MVQSVLTVDEYLDQRFDLPESGQWSELQDGIPVFYEPPDVDHGTAVLNLSKVLSEYVHREGIGYPCFDLGLIVARRPDSILFPAVSYFLTGTRFAEADRAATETVPEFVVELLSTPDRQTVFDARAACYLNRGTGLVWGIRPRERSVEIRRPGHPPHVVQRHEVLDAGPFLPGFSAPVERLFEEPEWYRRPHASAFENVEPQPCDVENEDFDADWPASED
jgi:Uma2 family endonuclease